MVQGVTPLSRLRAWQVFILVAVIYSLLAHLGEEILPLDGIAALWPASGFSAVMLLWAQTRGRRVVVLLAIVAGVGLSIAMRQMIFPNELGYLLGNLIEPVVMLPFITRAIGPSGRMERMTGVAWLALGGAIATGSAAIVVACTATWSFGGTFDPAATLLPTWRSFTTGDALGMLLVAPVLLQLQPLSRLWARGSALLQVSLWILLIAATLATGVDPIVAGAGMIVVVVMALRLDSSAAFLGALIVASSLVVAFLRGTLVYGLVGVDVIDVRLVLPMIAIITQIVAMGTSERLAAVAHAEAMRGQSERTKTMLDSVLAAVPVGVALYDVATDGEGTRPRFTLTFMNEQGHRQGGLDAGALNGTEIGDFVGDVEDVAFYDLLITAWAEGTPQTTIIDSRADDGFWPGVWDCTVLPVGRDQVLVEWSDVSELVEARQRAEGAAAEADASRTTLRHALDSGLDAFAIYQHDGDTGWHLLFVNAAGAARSGVLADELVGAPPDRVLPVEALEQILHLMDLAHATKSSQQSAADLTGSRTGWRADFDVTVTPTSKDRVLVTWRDTSELQAAYRNLRSAHAAAMHAATHDPLTNLPNRPLLVDRLTTALSTLSRTKEQLAVVYLDVDNFKHLNDRYGHAFGDAALMAVARRLRLLTREGDTAARLSGDEFVLLLTGVEEGWDANTFHDRLTSAMVAPVEHDGVSLHLSLSAGVRVTDGQPQTPESLLLDADLALYVSKGLGNGRLTVFTPELRSAQIEGQPTVDELQTAIRTGQIYAVYQPIVDVTTGQVVGREALVRWAHPRFGTLGPAEFLDLAERSGLIAEMGATVMHDAIADLAEGPSDIWVSVNLAPSQMLRANLGQQVLAECRDSGIDPARVVLELTEAQLLEATPTILRQLEQLRELGCRIAIDDFGTGYSSIAYLESFNVDVIKIDRGMILGEHTDRKRALISWVTGLAASLNCITVAEGIETPEQADLVRAAGIQLAQGYLFGRPEPLPRPAAPLVS